ncbi:type III-A CRISPR-associated RAMP protein Csm5 [Gordonibacter sp. An230]|uniref:type III-A CRISPR-associated RAMP protein Csm5 n=1 Tax=Gordonibacter sp. An230 TaxID=1965592 RepID=UPI001EF52FA8|nr:type III-A CRISPR-associated RAMP protein Csm5 [Gordonibacter sp. An230]
MIGPVHIGTGRTIGKKDYFLQKGKICVLDAARFVERLSPQQVGEYCAFLEGDSRSGLEDFLSRHGELRKAAQDACAYQLDTGLSKTRQGKLQYLEAAEFVKDSYGCPYVPGSSFKGMLRTALLAAVIGRDPETFVRAMKDGWRGRDWRRSANADASLNKKALWVERPDESDAGFACDIMRYVSVSDSDPLSVSDLAFVKKYDRFSKGDRAEHKRRMGNQSIGDITDGNELNIYRECLKPGTVVSLRLDVDERIDEYLPFSLDAEHVGDVFKRFEERYRACFADHFDYEMGGEGDSRGLVSDGRCRYVASNGLRCRNGAVAESGYCNVHKDEAPRSTGVEAICYLGGGVDFDSKTVLNALYRDEGERLHEISHVLYKQFPTRIDRDFASGRHRALWGRVEAEGFGPQPMKALFKGRGRLQKAKDDHRHWMDQDLGVSPHTLKLGKVDGALLPMGRCTVKIENTPDRSHAKGAM